MTELLDPTLAGCTMLVTADRRAGELGGALQRRGAAVRYAPALSMVPNESDALLVAATRDLLVAPPDIAVVTTGIGFRAWIEAADAIPRHPDADPDDGRNRVTGRITDIKGVILAEDVTGPYDVVVRAEARNVDEVGKLVVAKVEVLDGITRTLRCPVVHI